MKKKTVVRIMTILLVAITLCTIITPIVYGAGLDPKTLTPTFSSSDGGLKGKAQQIMGMIRNASAIIAVIILMILGVKYMLGSVEEKAEYKKSFVPLIVGIVVVVAATSIASFIFNMAG